MERLVGAKMIDFTIGIGLVFMIATGIAIFKLRKRVDELEGIVDLMRLDARAMNASIRRLEDKRL